MNTIRSICVYCGSSPGRDEVYLKAGHALGRSSPSPGLRLIYGGGTKGIMGAVPNGAMRAGGKVTGIIPRFLINKEATETALGRLDELVITENMHERKHTMFEKSDAFVALPGGIGTVEEIVEIMTWGSSAIIASRSSSPTSKDFWDPMLALIDHMTAEGFIHTAHRVKPLVVDEPEAIVAGHHGRGISIDAPTEGVQSVIDSLGM